MAYIDVSNTKLQAGAALEITCKQLTNRSYSLIPTLSSRGEPDLLNNLDRVFSMVKSMELKKQVIHTPIAGNGYKRAAEAPPTVSKHDSRRRKVVFEAGP
jgi:hypothetical protein